MGKNTKIGWCHHTFNAWWGCHKISPGCQNCYAAAMDKRIGGDHWTLKGERRFFGSQHWKQPIKWDKAAKAAGERHRVFCSSMADVFESHPNPDVFTEMESAREALWDLILSTPNLDWLLLTKRPENFERMLPWGRLGAFSSPFKNVWLGVTVEDQEHADERIPLLLDTDAAVRFLSCEPLLGPIDLSEYFDPCSVPCGEEPWPHIDWVIAGAESGAKARRCDVAWLRSLRDQCEQHDVAFFLKQAQLIFTLDGRNEPLTFGPGSTGKSNVVELPYLDGKQWAQFPEAR